MWDIYGVYTGGWSVSLASKSLKIHHYFFNNSNVTKYVFLDQGDCADLFYDIKNKYINTLEWAYDENQHRDFKWLKQTTFF